MLSGRQQLKCLYFYHQLRMLLAGCLIRPLALSEVSGDVNLPAGELCFLLTLKDAVIDGIPRLAGNPDRIAVLAVGAVLVECHREGNLAFAAIKNLKLRLGANVAGKVDCIHEVSLPIKNALIPADRSYFRFVDLLWRAFSFTFACSSAS